MSTCATCAAKLVCARLDGVFCGQHSCSCTANQMARATGRCLYMSTGKDLNHLQQDNFSMAAGSEAGCKE